MPRKPTSVWIGQVLIASAWLVFTAGYIYYAVLSWPAIFRSLAPYPMALTWFLARAAANVAAITFVGWCIVLISRRSPYGRWFGLSLLVLLLAGSVYASLNPSSSGLLPSNAAERGGYLIGQALTVGLYLVLLWRFGFSQASRNFFTRSQVPQ